MLNIHRQPLIVAVCLKQPYDKEAARGVMPGSQPIEKESRRHIINLRY
jgi:hypothetical protein